MENNFELLTKSVCYFVHLFHELQIKNLPTPKFEIVNDIYKTVHEDDPEYADNNLLEQNVYGLLYQSTQGELIAYVDKTQNNINFIVTACHEMVHFTDYFLLSNERKCRDFRCLQSDIAFLKWTEFHATYLSYRYYYQLCKREHCIDCNKCVQKLKKKYDSFHFKRSQIDVEEMTDFSMRLYGEIYALRDEFDELKDYTWWKLMILNRVFLQIFYFLEDNKNFNGFMHNYNEFTELIEAIQP